MRGFHLLLHLYSVKAECIANLQQAPHWSNHGSEIIGTWSYDNAATVHLACCFKCPLMVGLCGWSQQPNCVTPWSMWTLKRI